MPDKTHTTEPAQTRVSRTRTSGALTAADVLAVQRSAGNRAAQQLIAQRRVQARLTVGPVDDPFEREADRMADAVLASPLSTVASSPLPIGEGSGVGIESGVKREATPEENELQTRPLAAQITPLAQREAMPEEDEAQRQAEEEDEIAQTKRMMNLTPSPSPRGRGEMVLRSGDGSFDAGADVEQRIARSKGAGSPLPDATRTEMESKFGADFSGVRVHAGDEAAQLSRDLSAQAFTHGSDVYFGEGKFSPASGEGKHLLAHELTHVLQQQLSIRRNDVSTTQTLTSDKKKIRTVEELNALIDDVLRAIALKETGGKAKESKMATSAGISASPASQVQTIVPTGISRLLSLDDETLKNEFGLTKSELKNANACAGAARYIWDAANQAKGNLDIKSFSANKANSARLALSGFTEVDLSRINNFHMLKAQVQDALSNDRPAKTNELERLDEESLWTRATEIERKPFSKARERSKKKSPNAATHLNSAVVTDLIRKISWRETIQSLAGMELATDLGIDYPSLSRYAGSDGKKTVAWAEDRAAWIRLAVSRLTSSDDEKSRTGLRIEDAITKDEGLTLGRLLIEQSINFAIQTNPMPSDEDLCLYAATRHNSGKGYADDVLKKFKKLRSGENKQSSVVNKVNASSAPLKN